MLKYHLINLPAFSTSGNIPYRFQQIFPDTVIMIMQIYRGTAMRGDILKFLQELEFVFFIHNLAMLFA